MNKILSLTVEESIILFDMAFYTQINGVAMGPLLEPSLANAFLCHRETKWLNDWPKRFNQVFFKRYIYDIFVLFKNLNMWDLLLIIWTVIFKTSICLLKQKKMGKCPSLMSTFSVKRVSLWVTNFCRKKTFTGVF